MLGFHASVMSSRASMPCSYGHWAVPVIGDWVPSAVGPVGVEARCRCRRRRLDRPRRTSPTSADANVYADCPSTGRPLAVVQVLASSLVQSYHCSVITRDGAVELSVHAPGVVSQRLALLQRCRRSIGIPPVRLRLRRPGHRPQAYEARRQSDEQAVPSAKRPQIPKNWALAARIIHSESSPSRALAAKVNANRLD